MSVGVKVYADDCGCMDVLPVEVVNVYVPEAVVLVVRVPSLTVIPDNPDPLSVIVPETCLNPDWPVKLSAVTFAVPTLKVFGEAKK